MPARDSSGYAPRTDTLRLAAYSSGDNDGMPLPHIEVAVAGAPQDPCVWTAAQRKPLLLATHSGSFDLAIQQSAARTRTGHAARGARYHSRRKTDGVCSC